MSQTSSRRGTLNFTLSKLSHYPAPVRLGIFTLLLLAIWSPIAVVIYGLVRAQGGSPAAIQNTASLLTLPLLYGAFILLVRLWGQRVYSQPNLLWRYGLEFSQRIGRELLLGLAIGLSCLLALFVTQGILGWVVWKVPSSSFLRIALEGFIVSLGFGFAEELLFRGWLLDELERDYQPEAALWLSAFIYAIVHGLRLQLPALVLLGATLVWAKRSCSKWEKNYYRGRLGLPMGIHAGLVWGYYMVNVGQLIEYSNRVPDWITGIERNPLAGLMGILFMGGLALTMRQKAIKR